MLQVMLATIRKPVDGTVINLSSTAGLSFFHFEVSWWHLHIQSIGTGKLNEIILLFFKNAKSSKEFWQKCNL
jgi:hypothetical protein